MPSVVWSSGANSVTFPRGLVRGPHRFQLSTTVLDRTAGGTVVSYELTGVADLEMLDCEFPHVTASLLASVLSFKTTVIKGPLVPFTHTDNSESPAVVKTVRLIEFQYDPEPYTDPAAPRYTIRARLQVEPS